MRRASKVSKSPSPGENGKKKFWFALVEGQSILGGENHSFGKLLKDSPAVWFCAGTARHSGHPTAPTALARAGPSGSCQDL